jgi:hypothetical protein
VKQLPGSALPSVAGRGFRNMRAVSSFSASLSRSRDCGRESADTRNVCHVQKHGCCVDCANVVQHTCAPLCIGRHSTRQPPPQCSHEARVRHEQSRQQAAPRCSLPCPLQGMVARPGPTAFLQVRDHTGNVRRLI